MVNLVSATRDDFNQLLPLVRAYHEFEGITLDDNARQAVLIALMDNDYLGHLWKIQSQQDLIGYIALCFGFSIEFGGRDAFIDEFFILEPFRGQGYGQAILLEITEKAAELGVHALHLEVARDNTRAQKLYSTCGFAARDQFFLMSHSLATKKR